MEDDDREESEPLYSPKIPVQPLSEPRAKRPYFFFEAMTSNLLSFRYATSSKVTFVCDAVV